MEKETVAIYGKHAVLEALKKRADVIDTVYAKESWINDKEFLVCAKQVKNIVTLNEKKLPEGVDRRAVHQGLIATIDTTRLMVPFKKFKKDFEVDAHTSLVVLGEVQDPHNVGAIIRSAAAFGVSGVLIPKHRQAPVTGTVIKVSAGTAFSVPLISIGNVNNTLRDLKDLGFWVYGLDMHGDTNLHEEDFRRPSAFVVGNEGTGVREKTHALCDSILEIPMHKRAESLNASISTATALYAWSAKHPDALQ